MAVKKDIIKAPKELEPELAEPMEFKTRPKGLFTRWDTHIEKGGIAAAAGVLEDPKSQKSPKSRQARQKAVDSMVDVLKKGSDNEKAQAALAVTKVQDSLDFKEAQALVPVLSDNIGSNNRDVASWSIKATGDLLAGDKIISVDVEQRAISGLKKAAQGTDEDIANLAMAQMMRKGKTREELARSLKEGQTDNSTFEGRVLDTFERFDTPSAIAAVGTAYAEGMPGKNTFGEQKLSDAAVSRTTALLLKDQSNDEHPIGYRRDQRSGNYYSDSESTFKGIVQDNLSMTDSKKTQTGWHSTEYRSSFGPIFSGIADAGAVKRMDFEPLFKNGDEKTEPQQLAKIVQDMEKTGIIREMGEKQYGRFMTGMSEAIVDDAQKGGFNQELVRVFNKIAQTRSGEQKEVVDKTLRKAVDIASESIEKDNTTGRETSLNAGRYLMNIAETDGFISSNKNPPKEYAESWEKAAEKLGETAEKYAIQKTREGMRDNKSEYQGHWWNVPEEEASRLVEELHVAEKTRYDEELKKGTRNPRPPADPLSRSIGRFNAEKANDHAAWLSNNSE